MAKRDLNARKRDRKLLDLFPVDAKQDGYVLRELKAPDGTIHKVAVPKYEAPSIVPKEEE